MVVGVETCLPNWVKAQPNPTITQPTNPSCPQVMGDKSWGAPYLVAYGGGGSMYPL